MLNETGSTIYEMSFFFGLMLLAKGWHITRTNLESQEKKATICTLIVVDFNFLGNLFCLAICETAKQLNPFFAVRKILSFNCVVSIVCNVRGNLWTYILRNYHQYAVSSSTIVRVCSCIPRC
jgi:hypothetical protein